MKGTRSRMTRMKSTKMKMKNNLKKIKTKIDYKKKILLTYLVSRIRRNTDLIL